jgi:ribosomal protein L31
MSTGPNAKTTVVSDSINPSHLARYLFDGAAASCVAEAVSLPLEVAKVHHPFWSEFAWLRQRINRAHAESVHWTLCLCWQLLIASALNSRSPSVASGSSIDSDLSASECSVHNIVTDDFVVLSNQPTVQMRLQLQRIDLNSRQAPRYTGMLNAFSTIARQEGFHSLWKVCVLLHFQLPSAYV